MSKLQNTEESTQIQYEQKVIGGILKDGNLYDVASQFINYDDFIYKHHQFIFKKITELHKDGKPIEPLTLSASIDKNKLEQIGNECYLLDLAHKATTANFKHYCQVLSENANKRKLVNKLNAAIENPNSSFDSLSSNITKIIDGINNVKLTSELDKNFDKACLSCDKLAALEIREEVNLLPWLPFGGSAMIYAMAGVGKTLFGLSLAYAITSSPEFMGWKIGQNVGVLYVDGEMMLSVMRSRFFKFIEKEQPPKNFYFLSHQTFFEETKKDLSISKRENQEALLNYIEKNEKIKVIVFDNLSSLCNIREDKTDDWRDIMLPLVLRLRGRGIAVIVIHHAGKNGQQRGASGRIDQLDTVIKLTEMNEDDKKGAKFKIKFDKSRSCFGEHTEPRIAELITEKNDKYNCWHWKMSSVDKNTKQKLIKLIEETGGITCTEAAKELEISQPQISKYRRALSNEGIIEKSITNQSPMTLTAEYKNRLENNEK